jgi:hypothetical protein
LLAEVQRRMRLSERNALAQKVLEKPSDSQRE